MTVSDNTAWTKASISVVLWFCTIVRQRPPGLEHSHAVLKSLQRTLLDWRRVRGGQADRH